MLILDNIPEVYHEKIKLDFNEFVRTFDNINLLFSDDIDKLYTINNNYKNIVVNLYQYNKIERNILKHLIIYIINYINDKTIFIKKKQIKDDVYYMELLTSECDRRSGFSNSKTICYGGCRSNTTYRFCGTNYYTVYNVLLNQTEYYLHIDNNYCVPCVHNKNYGKLNVSSSFLNEYNKYELSKNNMIENTITNTIEDQNIQDNNNASNTIITEKTMQENDVSNITNNIENNTLCGNTFNINIIKNEEKFKMSFTNTNLLELNKQLKNLFSSDGILEYDVKNDVYTYIL